MAFSKKMFGFSLSKIWRSTALRMPERKDLDRHGLGNHTIVQMVMEAEKMNAADTGQLDVSSLRACRLAARGRGN